MNPFEFIIIFLAFVYSLALRLFMLAVNWLSTWDFRSVGNLSLVDISSEFLFVVLNYFFCALVSPDFEGGETYDLRRFHECEGPSYIIDLSTAFGAVAAVRETVMGASGGAYGAPDLLSCLCDAILPSSDPIGRVATPAYFLRAGW